MGVRFRVARGIRAEVAEGRVGQPAADAPRLIVAKSRTFMNETGWAVTRLLVVLQAAAGPDDRSSMMSWTSTPGSCG
jgi:peptidyl-tRNA hydrolase